MLLIVGAFRIAPERLAESRPHMAEMVTASRAEDGCLDYAYAEDLLDAGLIHVVELWRDASAFERHGASAHIGTWRAASAALGIGGRDLRCYEVGAPRPV